MSYALKQLSEQVVVITGATSGIGLATARLAAQRGAKLVLAARSEPSLGELADELNAQHAGSAVAVVADVGQEADVTRIAETAIARFRRIDTWINNAGVGLYGELLKTPIRDARKLFETNFWGVVYGSLEAARHFRQRPGDAAGAIINIGSEVGDRAVLLLGIYSASKHAVKGFTDALRMELEEADVPVSVTLVKPGATNTPLTEHAPNHMDTEPQLPDPVSDPSLVAEAVLYCAENPMRDIYPTGDAKQTSVLGQLMPRLTDWFMERNFVDKQQSRRPNDHRDALRRAGGGLRERGNHPHQVHQTDLYGYAVRHPYLTMAVLGCAGLLLAGSAPAAASAYQRFPRR